MWSPNPEHRRRFADEHAVRHLHDTCEALLGDPAVDVVYVASPHSAHMGNSLAALQAGKPVLCEKPFCINAGQARQVIAAARGGKLFLVEAM